MNIGNITIIEAESNFKKIDKSLIENDKIDCLTLGVYAKIVVLGKKWQLNIKGLSTHLNLSESKIRKSISILEEEGYIKRTPVRNEKGQCLGWDYSVFPTSIPVEERSKAGKSNTSTDYHENRVVGKPSCRKTVLSENGGDIIYRLKETIDLKNKETKKEKENTKKKKSFNVREDLSYVDEPFVSLWNEWIDYKEEIGKQYKTQRGAKMQYSSWIKFSDNNPILAEAIMKRSIEQSWEGLFALNDKQREFFLSDKSPYQKENTVINPNIDNYYK